jgi:lysophospholipase L1-like esterase
MLDLSVLLTSLLPAKRVHPPINTFQPLIAHPPASLPCQVAQPTLAIAPVESLCPEFSSAAIKTRFEPPLPDLIPANAAANPYLPQERDFDISWAEKIRPRSGSQLYHQRLEALRQGRTYTRLPANSFYPTWRNVHQPPTYEQWVALLQQEAAVMARSQGDSHLTILLGDSISQWYPIEQLTTNRFWLNQGISGDTTAGVLKRLAAFDQTRPDVIHVMAGVNDLKTGATDAEILTNLQQIMQALRRSHPQAKIVIHSILPTRWAAISSDRTTYLNQQIALLTQQEGASFLDLQPYFSDQDGTLRPELTTDGLHLNPMGYAVWGWVMQLIGIG